MALRIFIFMMLVSCFVQAQSTTAKETLEEVIQYMQKQSVNRDSVNWTTVTKEAWRLAENAKSPYDLGNSIRYLYQSLDDFHGSFRYKDSTFRWVKEKFSWKNIAAAEVYKAEFARKDNQVFSKMINDKVAYLRIPTCSQAEAQEKAKALQDHLSKLLDQSPTGLIIDMRMNGGGHLMCMTIGVSQLLSYGPITPTDEIRSDGFYRKPEKNMAENKMENIFRFTSSYKMKNTTIPIAIITGPFTGSSGEGLTMILKSRANTVTIGEPTAGWVSAVNGFKIDRNSHINLSVGYMTDINNTVYRSRIQPTISVIGGDNFTALMEDTKIQTAMEWLDKAKK